MTLPTPASATQPAPPTLTVVMTTLVCVSNPVEGDVGMYCQYRFQPGEWTNGKKGLMRIGELAPKTSAYGGQG